ncbi:MAG: hypothetical protein KAW00_01520 [Dehalococcoidia bacterium]|nr:hypothetical protein [Dehalococcoidia bacterium]
MAINVEGLIAQWLTVSRLFVPSSRLFPEPINYDKNLSEICLVSSREEFWQVYVCLMGFCQDSGREANEVLRRIPFESIMKKRRIEESFDSEGETFFQYCTRFKTLPRKTFFLAAYVLRLALAESSIKNGPPDIECIQSCLERYDGDPAFYECVREEQCETVEDQTA